MPDQPPTADPTPAPAAPPAPVPTPPPAPQPSPQPPATDDKLGEPGKAALDAERKARKEAEKTLKTLQDQLKTIEDKDKSELEKAQGRLAELEKQHAEERAMRLRLAAAAEHGIPKEYHDLLTATDEEALKAQAEKVAALVKTNGGAPTPLPGQGAPATPPAATLASGAALYAKRNPKQPAT